LPGAVYEARISSSRIGRRHLLDVQLVFPAITHVVEIAEALELAVEEIFELHASRGDIALAGEAAIVHAGTIDSLAPDMELVEVRVLPSHRGLDDDVQVLERDGGRDFDPAPDWWLGVDEGDLQADDNISHAAVLAEAAFQFRGSNLPILLMG
jgi:hypothetical protein